MRFCTVKSLSSRVLDSGPYSQLAFATGTGYGQLVEHAGTQLAAVLCAVCFAGMCLKWAMMPWPSWHDCVSHALPWTVSSCWDATWPQCWQHTLLCPVLPPCHLAVP